MKKMCQNRQENSIFTYKMLIILLLFCCSIGVKAQSSKTVISVECNNEPLSNALKKLERVSGLKILFTYDEVQNYTVSVSIKKKSVNTALKTLLQKIPFKYKIKGKFVYVTKSRTALLTSYTKNSVIPTHPESDEKIIHGKVYDSEGKALPGVTITLIGTKNIAITDNEGRYSLSIPHDGIIEFSFIGMESKSIKTQGKEKINISLQDNNHNINEVVVTGLMNYNAKTFTGNATVYDGESLKSVGHQNLIKSLALLDPSISLSENLEMGSNPNTMPTIRLRGESSFQGFENIDKSGLESDPNQPLFILDGYETTVSHVVDLDMNRIESVTILKDAAAGAIYGARAANGVIVIKTKRPKEGKLKISYNLDVDFNLPDLSSYNLLNAKENMNLIDRLGLYRYDDGTLRPEYNNIAKWVAEGVNTDWLSQPVRNVIGTKHFLNLQGGDQHMRYGVDVNCSNSPGVMKGSDRTNYGIGVNLSYNFKDKILFSNYLNVYQIKATESPYGNFSDYTKINSFYPIYDNEGKLYKYYYYTDAYGKQDNLWGNVNNIPVNPLYEANVGNMNQSKATNINDNFSFDWRILPTLRLNGRLSYTQTSTRQNTFLSPNSATYKDYGSQLSDVTTDDQLLRGEYTFTQTDRESLESNTFLTWAKNYNKHFITASIGTSISDAKSTVYGFTAQGFGDGDAAEPAYAQGYKQGGTPNNAEGHSRLASFFASTNYAYDNRYLLDFSYRLDGSSEFGSAKKTAPFYSTGIGWNMHNEKFIQKLHFINYLKLRATYGEVGSVNFSPYQAKDIYQMTTSSRYDGNIGVILMGLGNENLHWQNTKSMDIGINLSLFHIIDIAADYYRKITNDMVLPVTTPPSVGFNSFTDNLGKMRNQGYELSLRAYLIKKPRLKLSVFGSASHNENKILAISSYLQSYNKSIDSSDGMTENEYKQASHKFLTKYEENQSQTAIYAVRSLGIDPMTGDEIFLTRDGKPTKTWNASDKVVVGNTEPTVRGTFGTNIGWNGLYLNLTFSYQYGGQAYNQTLVDKVENSNKYMNVDKRVLTETWQKPGDIVRYKANVTSRLTQSYTYASSRFVQDLNILQLSSLSLQYDLPKKWISALSLEDLRLSFNTSDLLYLSTVKRERGTSYPYARTFTIGLRANF